MKIKIDFVTNSSCASFTIAKEHLTECQIEQIRRHYDFPKDVAVTPVDYKGLDQWDIREDDKYIYGDTVMDNFDMLSYLINKVGVDERNIVYEGCYG